MEQRVAWDTRYNEFEAGVAPSNLAGVALVATFSTTRARFKTGYSPMMLQDLNKTLQRKFFETKKYYNIIYNL